MGKTVLDRQLDDLVNDLQLEIFSLIGCKDSKNLPGCVEFNRADGIAKAIDYINSKFCKNYETDPLKIRGHYGEPFIKSTNLEKEDN